MKIGRDLFKWACNSHAMDFHQSKMYFKTMPKCSCKNQKNQSNDFIFFLCESPWMLIYSILYRETPKSKTSSGNMFIEIDILHWKLIKVDLGLLIIIPGALIVHLCQNSTLWTLQKVHLGDVRSTYQIALKFSLQFTYCRAAAVYM